MNRPRHKRIKFWSVLICITLVVPANICFVEAQSVEDISSLTIEANEDNTDTINSFPDEKDEDESEKNRIMKEQEETWPISSDEGESELANIDEEDLTASENSQDQQAEKSGTIQTQGIIGTSQWMLYDTGRLEIGAGTLPAFHATNYPIWSINWNDQITEIDFVGDVVANEQSGYLFVNLINVEKITNLNRLNTSNVVNMDSMFANMSSLTELDMNEFDTSNVISMNGMLRNMTSLETLILGEHVNTFPEAGLLEIPANMFWLGDNTETRFETSSDFMTNFNGSEHADIYRKKRIIGNFWGSSEWVLHDNGKLEIKEGTFAMSTVDNRPTWYEFKDQITEIEFTGDVIAHSHSGSLFANLENVEKITNLNRLNTSNVTMMWNMFSDMNSLRELDVGNFDTSNVRNMNLMFNGLRLITELDVSSFDTSNVEDMSYMFSHMSSLTKLNLSKFNTSRVTNMGAMFYNTPRLESLDISSFDTSNVRSMLGMFYITSGLNELDLSHFDTSNVTNMFGMFAYTLEVSSLNLSHFDTSNVVNMEQMFVGSSVEELNLSNFQMNSEVRTDGMFEEALHLNTLHLGSEFRFNGKEALRVLPEMMMWQGDNTNTRFDTSEDFMTNFNGSEHADIYRVIVTEPIQMKIPVNMLFQSNSTDLTSLESKKYQIENLSNFAVNVSVSSLEEATNISFIKKLKLNEVGLIEDGEPIELEEQLLMSLSAQGIQDMSFSGTAQEVEKETNPSFQLIVKFIPQFD